MSKSKPPKKKIVVTTSTTPGKPKAAVPARAGAKSRRAVSSGDPLLFSRGNYILMGVGIALIALGLLAMSGGQMPDPDIWKPELIYSPRRTVLAPALIIAGLSLEIYAIFKRFSPVTKDN
jgi:hypothetical protein